MFFAYSLLNNPEVNSRKIYQGHKYAVWWLKNHDKDNGMLLTGLLATLQTLLLLSVASKSWFCQKFLLLFCNHFSKCVYPLKTGVLSANFRQLCNFFFTNGFIEISPHLFCKKITVSSYYLYWYVSSLYGFSTSQDTHFLHRL